MTAAEVKRAYDDWQASEKSFGERHPKTLNRLAYCILIKNKHHENCDSLIEEFQARLENYKNWKNSDMPDALAAVAHVLYSKGDSKSAYPLIRRAAAIAEYLSEQNDYDSEFIWKVYVYVLRSLKRYEDEIPYDEKLYKYHLDKDGESSGDVVYYLSRLDYACYCCGQYSKSKKYSEKALELQKKYHAKDGETTLVCLSNLAFSLEETGPPEEELRIREEELALTQKIYGEDSEKGIKAYEKLCKALLKYSSNPFRATEFLKSKARQFHLGLLRLKTRELNSNNPSVLMAKRNLITVLERTGKADMALLYQEQLVLESLFQNSPPDFFSNRDRYHLAELYRECGKLENAVMTAEKLLSHLTAGLDEETVMRNIKSKSPSLDIKGILMTRVFLQKCNAGVDFSSLNEH